jgi:hypothetical protein
MISRFLSAQPLAAFKYFWILSRKKLTLEPMSGGTSLQRIQGHLRWFAHGSMTGAGNILASKVYQANIPLKHAELSKEMTLISQAIYILPR